MNKITKAFVALLLSAACIFNCIGYAEIIRTLNVDGNIALAPMGLYVTNVEFYSATSGATDRGSTYTEYTTNVEVNLNARRYASVTYAITVLNNTPYEYAYSGIVYERNPLGNGTYNGNQYIGSSLTVTTKDNPNDSGATFNTSDIIAVGEERTFYATYYVSRTTAANKNLKTLVNYKFGVNVDSVNAVVIDRMFNQFTRILNDTISVDTGYNYLIDIIDDKYGGGGPNYQWQATYIGNVTGSLSSDSEKVRQLFGEENLAISVDGEVVTNVTLLIKREDVDGNTMTGDDYAIGTPGASNYISAEGCEITLYVTTDPLDKSDMTPPIYAAVFTCDKDSEGNLGRWYMLGDMYLGTSNIIGYEGETNGSGSFQTADWRSTGNLTYKVTDDYSYVVSNGSTIQTIVQAEDATATAKLQALLDDAYDIIEEDRFAGEGMVQLNNCLARASHLYTVTDYVVTLNDGLTRAQIVPFLKELSIILANEDFLKK